MVEYVCEVCAGAFGGEKRSDSLELELQVVVSCSSCFKFLKIFLTKYEK